jgi:hypothetical protein
MVGGHNYFADAELFYGGRGRRPGKFLTYRRFDTLAHAVKFAVEELGTGAPYVSIESGELDFDGKEIKGLYESGEFPLERRVLEIHGSLSSGSTALHRGDQPKDQPPRTSTSQPRA